MLTYIVYYSDLFEERKKLTRVFSRIDKDNNHIISSEELRQGFKNCGINISDSTFSELFSRLDSNKDGTINYTEFLAAAVDWTLAIDDANLAEAFRFFDKDKNGSIDKDEIRRAVKLGWISEVQLANLLNDVDINNDQEVIYLL